MKKAALLALLLAGCEPDFERVATRMVNAEPGAKPGGNAPIEPPSNPSMKCPTKMVKGMAEITCR